MEHDPAVIAGVTLAIEAAIARAIALSPGTREQLQKLHSIDIEIQCTEPSITVFAVIDKDGSIQLSNYRETKATVSISGTWREFLSVASASDPAAMLINGDIKISGDTAPLLQLQSILSELDIDWEAPIVNLMGPVVGHQVAEVIRTFTSASRSTHTRMKRQVSEFILEEGRLSPPKPELDSFFSAVDDLLLRTDRAESRIKRLKKRLSSVAGVKG